ncbi:MAG: arylamine N-acetyltransferase [Thiolinea sp.]
MQRIAARPRIFPVLRPRTHMAVVATLEGQRWLCDPAFGGAMPAEPLCLEDLDQEIVQGHDCFRLTLDAEQGEYYLHSRIEGEWQTQYSFNLCPYEAVDFVPGNYLNSSHPDSFFRKLPVLVIFTEQGRNILSGERLKVMRDGVTELHTVTAEDYPRIYRDYFHITGSYPVAAPAP